LFSESWKHEVEIVSNRKLVRYGELRIKFCTHRPSRSENDENRTYYNIYIIVQLYIITTNVEAFCCDLSEVDTRYL
jgi:hypothetical protein